MVTLKKAVKMEKVRVSWRMEIDLMDGGLMMKCREKAHMFLWMVMSMKVKLKWENDMEEEPICMKMEIST